MASGLNPGEAFALMSSHLEDLSPFFAYSGLSTPGTIFIGITMFRCVAICMTRRCESYMYSSPRNTGSVEDDKRGCGGEICRLLPMTTNLSRDFVRDPAFTSKVFVKSQLLVLNTSFTLIPPVNLGPKTFGSEWKTDCMNRGGTKGGMVVGIRNNIKTSGSLTDIKCRLFHGGIELNATVGRSVVWDQLPSWEMICPPGMVMTAIYDDKAIYSDPDAIRCNALNYPWRLDTPNCHRINVYKANSTTLPLSPMNDPNMTGTATSVWGAQCGDNAQGLEGMTSYKLSTIMPLTWVEWITCCPLIF